MVSLPLVQIFPPFLPPYLPKLLLGPRLVNLPFLLPEPVLGAEVPQVAHLLVHPVELGAGEGVEQVPQLVRVHPQVVVGHHARHVLAVQVVVRGVDVAHAPVRVVVAVGARSSPCHPSW